MLLKMKENEYRQQLQLLKPEDSKGKQPRRIGRQESQVEESDEFSSSSSSSSS
jgi:hypothetical protein